MPYLVKRIGANMEDLHKNILRDETEFLMKNVSMVSFLLSKLYSKCVITSEEQEIIQKAGTQANQVKTLLGFLVKKDKNAFRIFCDALRSDEQAYIAERLEKAETDAKEQKRPSLSDDTELSSPGPSQGIQTSEQGRRRKTNKEDHGPKKPKRRATSASGRKRQARKEDHGPTKPKRCATSTSGRKRKPSEEDHSPAKPKQRATSTSVSASTTLTRLEQLKSTCDEATYQKWYQVLKQKRCKLMKKIQPTPMFFNKLLDLNVLNKGSKDTIAAKPTDFEKVSELLDYMHRRPRKDLLSLQEALLSDNQEAVVDIFNE